jgi:F-type H+-transporting ATPase subunit a
LPQSSTPLKGKPILIAQAGAGEVPAPAEGHETGAHAGVAAGGHEAPASPLVEHPASYYTGVAVLVLAIIAGFLGYTLSGGQRKRNPNRRQLLIEQCVASITYFARNAIGPGGERFAPLIGTVFAFVLVSNLMGVLPTVFLKTHEPGQLVHIIPAPTANLSMTIAISLVVFIVVQYAGIKENGIGGYLKHFAGPIPALAPLLFPIELVGALVKPISLSIRLFGNVFGEETVIAILVSLSVAVAGSIFLPIPFQFPMLLFGVFGGLVQAGVYTILTCAYIALSLGDHDDHGHGAEHDDVKDEFGAHVPAH